MLFPTVVLFIAYSIAYFIVSQRKMRKLRSNIINLNASIQEKNALPQKSRSHMSRVAVN